jgi:hypothetical protein
MLVIETRNSMPASCRNTGRPALLALLLVALTLTRGLIPDGFMPSGDGGMRMQLCPGHSAGGAGAISELAATGTGDSAPLHGQRHGATSCAFAAAALTGTPPPATGITFTVARAAAVVTVDPPYGRTEPSGPRRAQSPRAPPSLLSSVHFNV